MKGLVAITRRELAGLFLQPLAWVLLCLALFVHGAFFAAFLAGTDGDLRLALIASFGQLPFWVLVSVLAPLLTMRMIAEEARSGMLEFLLTAPVADASVVVGKHLAATSFFVLLWGTSFLFALGAQSLGAEVDWGQLGAGFLGAVLISALFCAIGLFASTTSSTPALAAFLAFLLSFGLLVAPGLLAQRWPYDDRLLYTVTSKFDVVDRYVNSFLIGAIDTGHLAFFLAWIALFLFLSVRLLEMRRWR